MVFDSDGSNGVTLREPWSNWEPSLSIATEPRNGAMLAEFMDPRAQCVKSANCLADFGHVPEASTRAPPTFSSSSMPRVWAPCRWTRLELLVFNSSSD